MDKLLTALNDLFDTREREFVAGERESVTGEREESVHRISQLLEEEGITSPEHFTDLLFRIVEHERLNKPIKDAGAFDPLRIDQNRNNNLTLEHRVPDVPFHHNGLVRDPNDVKRFDGDPLHWGIVGEGEDARLVACDTYSEMMRLAQRQNVLNLIRAEATLRQDPADKPKREHDVGGSYGGYSGTVFGAVGSTIAGLSAPTSVSAFVIPHPGGPGTVTCPAGPPRPPAGAQFFQHENFQGHWFWLDPGFTWPNLLRVNMGGVFGTDWNDKISSLKTGDGALVLFEHIDFRGSTWTFFGAVPQWRQNPGPGHPMCGPGGFWSTVGRQEAASLHPFGWNDRASSIRHFNV